MFVGVANLCLRVFFETGYVETTLEFRRDSMRALLRNAEQDLLDLGAGEPCMQALREHVLARFVSV